MYININNINNNITKIATYRAAIAAKNVSFRLDHQNKSGRNTLPHFKHMLRNELFKTRFKKFHWKIQDYTKTFTIYLLQAMRLLLLHNVHLAQNQPSV